MNAERYPLSWPAGWKRTPAHQRQRAKFRGTGTSRFGKSTYRVSRPLTVFEAIARLTAECDRLGAANALLSTNVQTRLDGLPRSDGGEPNDPGAALYFQLDGKPRCLACDRWNRVADNVAAIAAHIEAIRAVDRYGVGTMEQAFAGYAALPPSTEEWWLVLGVPPTATLEQIDSMFKALARQAHPDAGGTAEAMQRLNAARAAAHRSVAGAT